MANPGPAAGRGQAMIKEESLGPMGTSGMDPRTSLPTFIYDYLLKKKKYDLANALLNSDLGVSTRPRTKRSPDGRDVNGGGDNTIDNDPKLESMPEASISEQLPNESFLQDWWCVFWDIWSAGRNKNTTGPAAQYLSQATRNQQLKQQALQQTNMMNNARGMAGFPGGIAGMRNGGNANMRSEAIINNRNLAQMRSMNGLTPQQQAQLQAQGGDLGGQGRPQSPMSSDNPPSPKRARVDGGFGTPQMNPGARNPGGPMQMPNGPGQTPGMMPNGLDPMSAPFNGMGNPGQNKMQQFGMNRNFAGGMKNEFPGGQGMMGDYADMDMLNGDTIRMSAGGNAQGGALADYQVQLMQLEQQNKRRLLIARQEQDQTSSGGPPGPTAALMGAGPYPPGLSPRGGRSAQSSSPNDPMKRGNSNMGQSSPRPEGQMPITRGSPAPGGFDQSQMPPGVHPQFFNPGQTKMGGDSMMGPNGMRPGAPGFPGPGGNFNQQMEPMRARGQGGMPPGTFGGQGPQGPQGQGTMAQMTQQNLNNSQQNPMPPPQPPGAGGANAGRTNPSSPQQNANPPTPSQTKTANPKGNKKDTAKDKKAKQTKKAPATTTAIPASEAEGNGPPTPTPPTPITPVAHDNPFGSNPKNGQRLSNGQPPPQSNGAAPGILGQQDGQPFSMEGGQDDLLGFGADLGDTVDVLDNFDFQSFLHDPQDDTFGFDATGFNIGTDGVEMGSRDA